jgi:glutathione S-transferase
MMKLGGQAQVPFLVDQEKGVMMYESGDIVKYLDETYGKGDSCQPQIIQSGKMCVCE